LGRCGASCRRQHKSSFFEKNAAKKLENLAAALRQHRRQTNKSFLALFFKKEPLLFF